MKKTLDKIVVLLQILSLTSFLLLLYSADKSFDITDESYYLLQINYPELDLTKISFFGHILKLLFFDTSNIILLRLMGILLLVSASLVLSAFFLKSQDFVNLKSYPELYYTIIISFPLASLAYYNLYYIITPSYNWLSTIGALITLLGVFSIQPYNQSIKEKKLLGLITLSLGTIFSISGRIQGGLILVFGTCFYLIYLKKLNKINFNFIFKYIFLTFFLTLTLVLYSHNSLFGYINSVSEGLSIFLELNSGHGSITIIQKTIREILHILSPLLLIKRNFLILFFICLVSFNNVSKYKFEKFSNVIILLNLSFKIIFFYADKYQLFTLVSEEILIQVLITSIRNKTEDIKPLIKNYGVFFTYLFLLLFSTTLGTSSGIILKSQQAFIFLWSILILTFTKLQNLQIRSFTFYLFLWLLQLNLLLFKSALHPYRQSEPIFYHQNQITLIQNGKEINLKVDKKTYEWVKNVQKIFKNSNYDAGTNIIDLTGGSPGITYLIGAKPIGTPWFFGGYKGSERFTKRILGKIKFEILKRSWIVTASDGSRSISSQLLNDLGLNFPNDYKLIGKLKFTGHRSETQFFFKPRLQ